MTTSGNGERRCWVVGSINQDIVVFAERLPRRGETVSGSSSLMFPGGKGANQAVAMARLGARVAMIGRVGRDAFGSGMVSFLENEGVDVGGVRVLEDAGTGVALVTVDASSENTIVVVPGANASWAEGVSGFNPAAGDFVLCQMEIPDDVVAQVFREARGRGAATVFNPSPFSDKARDLVGHADVLIVNAVEAGDILGRELDFGDGAGIGASPGAIEAAGALGRLGPGVLVLTLGARGVVVFSEGSETHVAGVPVAAVDTTGAGDCFTGAFIAAMAGGAGPVEAAHFAVRASALSVTRRGAAASFPRLAEVRAFARR
ncbi:MAG TPA: ribokinase [Hyphomicrobiaceae bacterium]|nr:ribokinase [Hyphomicrobiaceae bacterium]